MGRLKRAFNSTSSNIGVSTPAEERLPRTANHGSYPVANGSVAHTTCQRATSPDSKAQRSCHDSRLKPTACQACMHGGVLCKFSPQHEPIRWHGVPDLTPIWLKYPRELVRQGQCDPSNKVSARQIGFVSSGGRHVGRKLEWRDPELPRGVCYVRAN